MFHFVPKNVSISQKKKLHNYLHGLGNFEISQKKVQIMYFLFFFIFFFLLVRGFSITDLPPTPTRQSSY